MDEKIINFPKDGNRYRNIAERLNQEGKPLEALGFLFTALKNEPKNSEVVADIADTYADMGLSDFSNKYWFKYIDLNNEDKISHVYEELAINYFYLDNYWASSYYFHLKLATDGFISRDSLSEEIIEFLNESFDKKSAYFIAYPYDRADYSAKLRTARRAFSAGDYKTSSMIYSSVPTECMDEDSSGDLAVSYFMCKEDENAIDACKQSIKVHGENVTAYCNLSNLYFSAGDQEKSSYYYQKALSLSSGANGEEYKIATCAIEQNDSKTAASCIGKILKERVYDPMMWYLYGVALTNTGDLTGGARAFKKAYNINPTDKVYEYYAMYVSALADGGKDTDKALPLSFEKSFPEKVIKYYKKLIRECEGENATVLMKNAKNREIFHWGVANLEDSFAKKCSAIIGFSGSKQSEKFLFNLLLDPEVSDERKRLIIFTLIICGKKNKFGVVAGNCYVRVKPRKLIFEDAENAAFFTSAYALCVSRAIFFGIDDLDKIGFNINKVYKRFGKIITLGNYSIEDVSALTLYICGYKRFNDLKKVCSYFGTDASKVSDMAMVLKGE